MSMRRPWFMAALIVCVFAVTSCATAPEMRTVITGSWKDGNFNKKLSSFLIISLSQQFGIRGEFENAVARRFGLEGLRAEPSSDLMSLGQPINRETVKAAMADKGFDAVLVSRLIDVENEAAYVPPSVDMTFDNSLYQGSTVVAAPGYTEHRSVVSLQIDLYSTETEHLIWSLKSKIFNPTNITEVDNKLADAIVSDLRAKGLI
jgi:hypothetical protein